MKSLFLFFFILFFVSGCTSEKAENIFSAPGSALQFKRTAFDDTGILAQAGGLTVRREQILDKSAVIQDIDRQEKILGAALLIERLLKTEKNITAISVFLADEKVTAQEVRSLVDTPVLPTPLEIRILPPVDGSTLVAMGTRRLRKEDVDQNNFRFQALQERRFTEVLQQLSSQLVRIAAAEEARTKNQSLQEFIASVTPAQNQSVSEAELAQYFSDKGILAAELKENQIENIRSSLKDRKVFASLENWYAEKLRGEPILVSFEPPRAELALDTSFKPIAGYATAPVTVVVFSSALCSECEKSVEIVNELKKNYNGSFKANWIHTPSLENGMDVLVSNASLCSEAQKPGSSIDLIAALEPDTQNSPEQKIYDWVEKRGLNVESFKTCLLQGEQNDLLQKHVAYSRNAGIQLNPTVWVNGHLFSGFLDKRAIQSAVETEIKEAGENRWSALLRRLKAKLGFE